MKILHISTSDNGGAGKACIRLHSALLNEGIESKVLVLDKYSDFRGVTGFNEFKNAGKINKGIFLIKRHLLPYLHEKKLKGKPEGYEIFSFPNSLFDITRHPLYKQSDIVNLHFTSQFLDIKSFFKKNKKPVVWTLHDLNSFTGGCHYSSGCNKFEQDCTNCPQLEGIKNSNVSNKILLKKIKFISNFKSQAIIAPSLWLMNLSKSSRVFKDFMHFNIPHGIDTDIFKPKDMELTRNLLSLPVDKKVIFYISEDFNRKNKGFHLLKESLNLLRNKNRIILCLAGKNIPEIEISEIKIHNAGFINDEVLLSLYYSAADLTAVPSIEEVFSLVTLESLSSGTPVVAFNSTGPKELIKHSETGWLAEPYSAESFSEGIDSLISDDINLVKISKSARNDVLKRFNSKLQASMYINVYRDLL